MTKLIGLDLGLHGLRYESYDLAGRVLASGRGEIRKQEGLNWLTALRRARDTAKDAIGSDELIVSAQSTSGTVLLVDKYGDEVLPPLMYYERAVAEAAEVNSLKSAAELAQRGVAISSTSPIPKILEARRKHPQRFAHLRWIISPTTWLLYKLAYPKGEEWKNICTDWTNGLKYGVDPTPEPHWYEPFFQEVGVDLGQFPRLVPCGEELGDARSELADALGLRGARLFQGMTEGNASALAVGCLKEGDFGFSIENSTVFKYVCDRLKVHPALYYHKHPFKGYLAGAAPVTGGTFTWFAEKVMGVTNEKAFSLAEECPPGTEFSYFPQGDRSPFDDPQVGASFLGIWRDESTRDFARGRVLRSMLLGLTFLEYYYLSLFQTLFERKIDQALITGEGTKSDWWNRLRASIYDIPVKVMEERAAIGALLPIVMRLKLFKTLEEAQTKLLRMSAVYEPDTRLGLKYDKMKDAFFDKWKIIREASKFPDSGHTSSHTM